MQPTGVERGVPEPGGRIGLKQRSRAAGEWRLAVVQGGWAGGRGRAAGERTGGDRRQGSSGQQDSRTAGQQQSASGAGREGAARQRQSSSAGRGHVLGAGWARGKRQGTVAALRRGQWIEGRRALHGQASAAVPRARRAHNWPSGNTTKQRAAGGLDVCATAGLKRGSGVVELSWRAATEGEATRHGSRLDGWMAGWLDGWMGGGQVQGRGQLMRVRWDWDGLGCWRPRQRR